MQHDNHTNHQIDQQLRELEQYSLPDLSKQDDHWKSMSAMIGTSMMPPSQPAKGFFSRSIFKWITGAVLAGGAAYFIYTITSHKETHHAESTEEKLSTENEQLPAQAEVPRDTIKTQRVAPVSDSSMEVMTDTPQAVYENMNVKAYSPVRKNTIGIKIDRNKNVGTYPIVVSSNEAVNRDTFITASTSVAAPHPASPQQLRDFFNQLSKKPQQFAINNLRDTVITGKEGTVLHIPKNSFNVNGTIIITLREFYSIEDMIMNKLSTTTTDGRQLVSGGMVYISATSSKYGDSLLPLRKGVNWRMEMPKTTDSSMQLFYGRRTGRNDSFDTDVKWEATGQVFGNIVSDTTRSKPLLWQATYDGPKDKKKGFFKRLFGYKTEQFDIVKDTMMNGNGISIPALKTSGPVIFPVTFDTLAAGSVATIREMGQMQQSNKVADVIVGNLYGVNISNLGWINCDRFLGAPLTTHFSVSLDTPSHYRTILVFDRMNSVMAGTYWEKDRSTFYNIPVGEKVKVICVGIDNGKTISAMKEFIVEANQQFDLSFTEVDPAMFARQLQKPGEK